MLKKIFILGAVMLAAACSASKDDLLKTKVEQVKRMLERTKRDPMARASFAAASEGGGSVISYITANLPEGEAFTCYELGKPTKPDCIYFRPGTAEGEFIIEGYLQDLTKPAVTASAFVDPRLRPGWVTGEQAAPAEGQAGEPAQADGPVLTAVSPQWIISDSVRKIEIILMGYNLSRDATVVSLNPLLTIDRVEPDPARTSVIAQIDPSAPAGDYELQYQAPGAAPIPFTFRYTK